MVLRSVIILLISLAIHLPIICYSDMVSRDNPIDFALLKTDLQRGISTQDDVRRIFGEPTGSGDMQLLLPTNPVRRDVWFYEDLELSFDKKEKRNIFQQGVLLIFFNGERYDGYWWFSHTTKF
jgi:hypothetical protein